MSRTGSGITTHHLNTTWCRLRQHPPCPTHNTIVGTKRASRSQPGSSVRFPPIRPGAPPFSLGAPSLQEPPMADVCHRRSQAGSGDKPGAPFPLGAPSLRHPFSPTRVNVGAKRPSRPRSGKRVRVLYIRSFPFLPNRLIVGTPSRSRPM